MNTFTPCTPHLAVVFLKRLVCLLACLAGTWMGPAWAALNNNGGTISDTDTGLMWDRCGYGATNNSCGSGVQLSGTWSQALKAVVEANAANYKGYNDWRLPNKNELDSIIKETTFNPAIDTNMFPLTAIPGTMEFWSATSVTADPDKAWRISFYEGDVSAGAKSDLGRVRLVRLGQDLDVLNPPPPVLINVGISNVTTTTATLTATSDSTGIGYWLLLPAGSSPAPSAEQVLLGQDSGISAMVAAGSEAMVADTPKTFPVINDLSASTTYDMYVVADNQAGVLSLLSGPTPFTTLADPNPPTTQSLSIIVSAITTAVAATKISENGTGYWLNLLATDSEPTVAEVLASPTKTSAMNAELVTNFLLTGLTADTAYKLYFVAKDLQGNTQAAVLSVDYTTKPAAIVLPPNSTLSILTAATTSGITIGASSDKVGRGYWLNQLSGVVPTTEEIIAGGTTIALPTAGTAEAIVLTGLKSNTNYTLYFVAEDEDGNEETTPSQLSYQTLQDPLPIAILALVGTPKTTSAMAHAQINENGTGYWLNQLTTAPPPDVDTLVATGQRVPNMLANTGVDIELMGLTPATGYTLYFVARDAVTHLLSTITSQPYTTATAITSTLVAVGEPGTTTAQFKLTLSKDGTGHGVYELAGAGAIPVSVVQSNSNIGGSGSLPGMSANQPENVNLTGLAPGTTYTLFYVGEDVDGNLEAAVNSLQFTTKALPGGAARAIPSLSQGSLGLLAVLLLWLSQRFVRPQKSRRSLIKR